MKRIFTLLILLFTLAKSNGQAILNEVYAFPGGSRNEFFEFYNNSIFPQSMDNYTIVTYYEEGSKKGFFVLDLPNLTVAPQGYFVGSSAIPFNYQGVTNSTSSQYSWNDLVFMGTNNAYLRKWELGTSIPGAIDGNDNYDLAVLPSDFNDIFQKIGGGSATYNVFVYRNGTLLSIFLGGTGGNTFIPNYMIGLPNLNVDMSAGSPDFTIPFSTYATARTEFVIQDIGSDNGYIRLRDGFCGAWTKSSSQVTHTPGVTNAGTAEYTGVVSVSSVVVHGNAITGSTVNYDVVSAPVLEFPITMNVYADNGSVPGQVDVGDTYITSATETVVTDGPFSTVFFPYNANILIQTMTSAGCIDNLRFIPNTGVLPVRFMGFQVMTGSAHTELSWYVADNEGGKQFEVQRSTDGKEFSTMAVVFPTIKAGNEKYIYNDAIPKGRTWYRIKLTDHNNQVSYTNTMAVGNSIENTRTLSLNQNPVESYLSFQYHSPENTMATVNIYNTSGALMYSQRTNLTKDANSVAINLDGKIFTGLYILEVKSEKYHNTVKFIKR